MTNYDIERIEKFMDKFELSMNEIFAMMGTGVCASQIYNTTISESSLQFLKEMDDYIFNELLENGGIRNDSIL